MKAPEMTKDRFGNDLAPGLPYARGDILASTADDLTKLKTAWEHVRAWEAKGCWTTNWPPPCCRTS